MTLRGGRLMDTITVNLSKMFSRYTPWDCCNSAANLGERVGELTWQCCTEIAESHGAWLITMPLSDVVSQVKDRAKSYGAWDDDEINSWTDTACVAFLVQEVADVLRPYDDLVLVDCADCINTSEDNRIIQYTCVGGGELIADLYLGE